MVDLKMAQRARRDKLFLKGPVYFGWVTQNVPDLASRLILIAEGFMNTANPAKTEYALSQGLGLYQDQ